MEEKARATPRTDTGGPDDKPDWLVRFDAAEERKRQIKEALFREMVRIAGLAGARRYRRMYGKRVRSEDR